MNKLFVTLLAGAIKVTAHAQTPDQAPAAAIPSSAPATR